MWHRFKSRLINFIEEEAYKYTDFSGIIDRLSKDDTPDDNNWRFMIFDAKDFSDFPKYIKPIIERFLPNFLKDFPEYKSGIKKLTIEK